MSTLHKTFLKVEGYEFNPERVLLPFVLHKPLALHCLARPCKATWEQIGSQGREMQPMRGKDGPWGKKNQPITSLSSRSKSYNIVI